MLVKVGLGRYEMMGMAGVDTGNRLTLFKMQMFPMLPTTPQGLSIDDVEHVNNFL